MAEPDPLELADIANAERAKRAQRDAFQRARAVRRAAEPLPAGGLFDEVRRNTLELF